MKQRMREVVEKVSVYEEAKGEIRLRDYVRVEGYIADDWGEKCLVALAGRQGIREFCWHTAHFGNLC